MKNLVRCLVLAWGLAALPHASQAISDVPAGSTVWLQGYDLSPLSPSFRNDGIVKLECIDDALSVYLFVADPGLHNGPGGLLLFSAGAGGDRVFGGDLMNEGSVQIGYTTEFVGAGSVIENRGEFLVEPVALARFRGPDIRLLQQSGRMVSGFLIEVIDGRFDCDGGSFEGQTDLVRSQLRVGSTITNAFTATLLGSGSGFEGRVLAGQRLRVAGSVMHGNATARFDRKVEVEGQLDLTGLETNTYAVLIASAGLAILPAGTLTAEGEGGRRELRGVLDLRGQLRVDAALDLFQAGVLTNQGTVLIGSQGTLRLNDTLRQRGGRIEIRGGMLASGTSTALEGGMLSGFGWIEGAVTNAATISLEPRGNSLVVGGSLSQPTNGTIAVMLRQSSAASPAPALRVTDTATLHGTLSVALADGYQPGAGDRFPLLAAARFQGAFDRLDLPALSAGLHWVILNELGTMLAAVTDAPRQVSLRAEISADRLPRLRVSGADSSTVEMEYSVDLVTWRPFSARLQFAADGAWVTDLPGSPSAAMMFFRIP